MIKMSRDNVGRRGSRAIILDWDTFLIESKRRFEENVLGEPDVSKSLDDFHIIRTIGTGAYGTVVLARSEFSENYYAIKILKRSRIVKLKQVSQALNEKRLLFAVNFPFIVRMAYFFKDNSYIYYVLPFISGGEVFKYLRKEGKFDEKLSAFYAAQVVMALEYLHYLNIIYRDLKPENVLIDKYGYIKITDLGFAKIVGTRTYTLCGTPDYFAPEMILSKGYSHPVDWWSLGVFIYELTAGYPPFYDPDPMKTYERITAGSYSMIPSFSPDLKSIIFGLLQVDVSKRLGEVKGGANNVRNQRWFKRMPWLDLLNKKIKPPFIPKVTGPGDATNFEEYDNKPLRIASVEQFQEEFKDF